MASSIAVGNIFYKYFKGHRIFYVSRKGFDTEQITGDKNYGAGAEIRPLWLQLGDLLLIDNKNYAVHCFIPVSKKYIWVELVDAQAVKIERKSLLDLESMDVKIVKTS